MAKRSASSVWDGSAASPSGSPGVVGFSRGASSRPLLLERVLATLGSLEPIAHACVLLLVRPGDSAGLARAIDRVVGDPALRAQLRDGCLASTEIPSQMDLAAKIVGER